MGFDPGGLKEQRFHKSGKEKPGTSGFAVLNCQRWTLDRKTWEGRWVAGHSIVPTRENLIAIFNEFKPDLVAVEVPATVFRPQAMRKIMNTKGVAHEIVRSAEDHGLIVMQMEPRHWRKPLCGIGAAKNAHIEAMLRQIVAGLPKITNSHVRDAAGVAHIAGRKQLNRGIWR